MLTADDLDRIGGLVYGEGWPKGLAAAAGVDDRDLRRIRSCAIGTSDREDHPSEGLLRAVTPVLRRELERLVADAEGALRTLDAAEEG